MSETEAVEATEQETQTETAEATASVSDSRTEKQETAPAAKAEEKSKVIADGVAETVTEEAAKPYWPEDWRQKVAEHVGGKDKKAVAKELKRLERLSDPTAVFGMYRDLEAKFSEGGLIKVPKEGASEEEIKRYREAMGIPEKADAYIDNLKLPDGITLGDDDKAIAKEFAEHMHSINAPQPVMDKAMDWYFKQQEAAAAAQDEFDENYRVTSERELREEYGPKLKGVVNSIGVLKNYLGADLMDSMMVARMPDGTIAGNNPALIKGLAALAREINPVASVMETSETSGKSLEEEIKQIESSWRDPQAKRDYYKDEKKQARYRELIAARDKMKARAA